MVTLSRDAFSSQCPPTDNELRAIATGDQHCCKALISRFESLVTIIAKRRVSRSTDLDDLMQVGRLAVYQAALKYNRSCAVPFDHYVKRAVKNQILKEALRLASQRRHETSTLAETAAATCLESGIGQASDVREWVRGLGTYEALIFQLIYTDGLRQRLAARAMGVSQPRVAQLHRRLLDLARRSLCN